MNGTTTRLRARRLEIDTYSEPIVFLRPDCPVTQAEGFAPMAAVQVRSRDRTIIATLNVVYSDWIASDEAGLSEVAWNLLEIVEHDLIEVGHPPPFHSFSHVRSKIYGNRLSDEAIEQIVSDIAADRYSRIHLSAFLTACAAHDLDDGEVIALTRAMLGTGSRLDWGTERIVDKHCVGGLPGNRTTPIVVAIVAAAGMTIPKTSSRAITSPAGTADTMEVLAPVDLSLEQMRTVVEREGGCVVWGGSMRLAPVDDVFIRVEHPLNIDSHGQLVASVMAKKLAAGSTHVVIDIPIGPTAKVRSDADADQLARLLTTVGEATGIQVRVVRSEGLHPVGRGIGPALEARDVLAVLQSEEDAPRDLRDRAVTLAGHVLELGDGYQPGEGRTAAAAILEDGRAWTKFQAICEAQGGMRTPPRAPLTWPVRSREDGRIARFDNRRLANVAKFAGAPKTASAGVEVHVAPGDEVERGQPLFTIHAASQGAMAYALDYVGGARQIVLLEEAPE